MTWSRLGGKDGDGLVQLTFGQKTGIIAAA